MDILKKITSFLKNKIKKQNLLEEPKNFDDSKSSFMESIHLDEENLYDPKKYEFENFIPSILRALGVNKKILDNPAIIKDLSSSFWDSNIYNLAVQQDVGNLLNMLRYPSPSYSPSESDVKYLLEKLSVYNFNGVLSPNDRMVEYNKLLENRIVDSNKFELYVDKKTGNFYFGSFSISGTDSYNEVQYFLDDKGNVVKKSGFSVELSGTGTEEIMKETKTVFNRNGIELEKESTKNSSDKKIYRKAIRDSEFPFVVQESLFIKKGEEEAQKECYMPIDLEDLSSVSTSIIVNDKPIRFNTREEISQYYDENKESIESAFNKNKGLYELAKSSGILKDVSNKEPDF